MQKEIKHSWFFSHSPEEVWTFLTNKDLIAKWLMPNDFEPVSGHDFKFNTKPIPSLNLDGIFYCKVLEIIPYKKLIYTWKGGPGNELITLDTLVVWSLQPKDNGTELRLVHSGFKEENISIFSGMDKGWFENIKKITGLLNAHDNANSNS
jgi:uncharacterized protein YndB with AHSA1/START domain